MVGSLGAQDHKIDNVAQVWPVCKKSSARSYRKIESRFFRSSNPSFAYTGLLQYLTCWPVRKVSRQLLIGQHTIGDVGCYSDNSRGDGTGNGGWHDMVSR